MRKTLSTICGLIIFISFSTLKAAGKHDGSFLHVLSDKYMTPHQDWCGKFAGGTLDAMFIIPRGKARGAVEMAQRFDLKLSATTTAQSTVMAKNNIYEGACSGTSIFEKNEEVIQKVSEKHDVFIIGNFLFTALPPEAQLKILQQVQNGAGLVIVYPRRLPYKKLYLHPLKDANEDIMRLAPSIGLPPKAARVNPDQLVKAWSLGKGRIVQIDYQDYHNIVYTYGMALEARNDWSSHWAAQYENNMVLLIRAMIYATGWEPPVRVSCPEFVGTPTLSQGKRKVSIRFSSPTDGSTEIRLRDSDNKVVFKKEISISGQTEHKVELPFLSAGRYYCDLIMKNSSSQVVDFGYQVFNIESPVGKIDIETSRESFKPGEAITARLVLEKALAEDAVINVELIDSPYGRVWNKAEIKLKAGQCEVNIEIEDPRVPTLAGFLECALICQGEKIASERKAVFFQQPYTDPYVQMVWDSIATGYAPFQAEKIVDGLSWNCALTGARPNSPTPRIAAFFNQRLVPYIARVMMASTDVKNLCNTHGKKEESTVPPDGWTRFNWMGMSKAMAEKVKELDGDESLYNPKARKLMGELIRQQVGELPKFAPLAYNLGDENFFSYEAGYSPSDNQEFTRFITSKYGTIDRLNAAWNSSYSNFEEVPHLTTNKAKADKNYAAWYDQRQFMEKAYSDLHHFLADEIRQVHPDAKVGAEGSQPADMEQTIDTLEFWGPYSRLCENELLRSIGSEKIRMHWWGGYVGSHGGRGKYPMPLWRSLLTGTVNGSAWFAGNISPEGMLGADLSYAAYFKDLIPFLKSLKNGIAQLLITTPLKDDGIAVLWSHASNSARLLESRFVNPADSMEVFIRFCYHNGLNFDMVTPKRVAQGALEKKKVLFLFGTSSVSDMTTARISQFTRNGGIVIADMNPAILNEKLAVRKTKNPLEELFGDILLDKLKEPLHEPLSVDTTFRGVNLSFDSKKALVNPSGTILASRKIGKGDALLLNFSLSSASLTASKKKTFDAFMLNLLAACDIKPSVKVTGLDKSNHILRIRSNQKFELIGYLAEKSDAGKTVEFEVPQSKHIYRPGYGYVGNYAKWSSTLDSPFVLFSLFDQEQSAPPLVLDSHKIKKGGSICLNLSGLDVGDILYLQLSDPEGKIDVTSSKVIVTKEKEITLDFPFNAQSGDWKLSLEAVATGLKSSSVIKVE